jgi:hypothetical protein
MAVRYRIDSDGFVTVEGGSPEEAARFAAEFERARKEIEAQTAFDNLRDAPETTEMTPGALLRDGRGSDPNSWVTRIITNLRSIGGDMQHTTLQVQEWTHGSAVSFTNQEDLWRKIERARATAYRRIEKKERQGEKFRAVDKQGHVGVWKLVKEGEPKISIK